MTSDHLRLRLIASLIRYSARPGQQAGLGWHYDESCFSYVIALNDVSNFEGGGTLFGHAEHPISVPPSLIAC
jgi:hypothetical protein